MKFTSSYLQSTNIFEFEDAESPFNFEETQSKSLADLIPEIDALCGAVQYPSFECFEQILCEVNVDIKLENEMEGIQSDSNIEKEASNQSLTQPSAGIISQVAHSEAQSSNVDKVFIKSLKKDNNHNIKDKFEHQLQNVRGKPNKSNKRRSKRNLKGSSKLNSINPEEMQLITRKNETRKYRVRVQRQHGVKLKRWGREKDRKVFSY